MTPLLRIVAIDGVLGSGKTTVARRLAPALELHYLDTGAMYRSVALACLWSNTALDDHNGVVELARTSEIEVRSVDGIQQVRLNGDDVTEAIRAPDVARAASSVATIPAVRAVMVSQQRTWANRHGGGVLEGRDIATVVFPDAPVKIFLTASVNERAQRRHNEQPNRTFDEVKADLEWRDRQDSEREADPLRIADGATVVDTTGMTLEDVVAHVTTIAKEGLAAMHTDTTNSENSENSENSTNSTNSHEKVRAAENVRSGEDGQSREDGAQDTPTVENVIVKHAQALVRPPTRFEKVLWQVIRTVIVGACRLLFRVTVEGLEHVPANGAYLVSPTHRSVVDSFVVPIITKRRIRFLGKESVFKYRALVPLWHAMGGIRVVRGTTDRESMRICMAAMAGGEPLAVYPEGRRKEGPVVEDLFDGPAFMAIKAGVPILPIGIGGSENAMGKGRKIPRPAKIHLIIGPLLNNPPMPTASGRSSVRALTSSLQAELQRLFDLAKTRV